MDGKRKYYIVETYQRKGPFNIEELKKYGINKDTLIWAFELDEPLKASEINELKIIFNQEKTEQNKQTQQNPPNETQKNINNKPNTEEIIANKQNIEQNKQTQQNPPNETQKNINKQNTDEITTNSQKKEKISSDKQPNNKNTEIKTENNLPKQNNIDEKPNNLNTSISYASENSNQQIFQNVEYKFNENNTYSSTPKNYIIWSILITILCCNPFAFAAIITGLQVEKRISENDIEGAQRISKTTKTILIISAIIGLIAWISIFIFTPNN